jgi:hypothetical protein
VPWLSLPSGSIDAVNTATAPERIANSRIRAGDFAYEKVRIVRWQENERADIICYKKKCLLIREL